jgi:CheY-like chemotaxis protein
MSEIGPILVVEDVKHVRDLLVLTLRFQGYEVIAAADGEEALQRIAQHRPSLVITDILMPRLDGYALAYRLRTDAVGTFIWQWNEPWPAICWSVWPYQGPPKPAYTQIARSYAPVAALAQLQEDEASIWLVNDTLEAAGMCTLSVRLDDTLVWQGEVTPEPGQQRVTRLPLPPNAALLTLELQGAGVDFANDYDLAWWRQQDQKRPGWGERLRARLKDWVLRW